MTNSVACLYAGLVCNSLQKQWAATVCSYIADACFSTLCSLSTCLVTDPRRRDKETVERLLWKTLVSAWHYKSCLFALWLSWKSYVSFLHAKWDWGSLHREQPMCSSCDYLDSGTEVPPSWQWRIENVCPSQLIKHSHACERGSWIIYSLFW